MEDLKEILKNLVASAYREMGTDWCSKMINKIDALDSKKLKNQSKRIRNTCFKNDGNGMCIHCGKREGSHIYSTNRCRI